MTSILKEELEKIGNYELMIENRLIKRKENLHDMDICSTLKVVSLLNKYGFDYCMDSEYNFAILG